MTRVSNQLPTIEERLEINTSDDLSTINKMDIYYQQLKKTLKYLFVSILIIVMFMNPISFIVLAVLHWKCDYETNLPQLMIVWAIIHFIVYLKLIYLRYKNNFNVNYLNSKIQILLNFCLIVWFVVFILLIVILSNGRPDDFTPILMCYIIMNMFLSFVIFGIPCILVIAPAICDAR